MQHYLNLNGNSGVNSFELGNTYIRVIFKGNYKLYQYSYNRAGEFHVENMKKLAIEGSGLNSYINQYVRHLFDRF
jgi:archaellin